MGSTGPVDAARASAPDLVRRGQAPAYREHARELPGVLALQRTAGNRATATLLQRTAGDRATATLLQRAPATPTVIVHEHRQVTTDATQTTADVERFIIEKGWQNTGDWAYRFINADPASDLKYGGDDDLVKRCRATLKAEIISRQERVKWLTGHIGHDLSDASGRDSAFETEADKETLDLLDKSEEKLKAEMSHYGLKAESSWLVFTNYSMTGGPLQQGMQTAAKQLAAQRNQADILGKTFTDFKRRLDAQFKTMGDKAFEDSGVLALAETARKPWMEAERGYREACNKAQQTYPILASYSSGDDAAEKLSELSTKKPADLAESLYKTIDDRIQNIGKVRSQIREPGGRYNAWKHPPIIARTKPRLGLQAWESRIVDENAIAEVKRAKSDDDATTAALIAVGLGLLSAIPTGGSGLIAGVAAGAAVLGTAYSLATLYDHYQDYSLASAEHLSTLDQAEAISQEEPNLMWLAWDLLDAGLNIVGAASAFKTLRGAMVAAEKGGLKALPELIKTTERSGLGIASRSRVVSTVLQRTGNQSLEQMLKAIREGLAAAKPAPGKEALLDAIKAAADKLAKKHIARIGPSGAPMRAQIVDIVRALEASDKVVLGDAGKVRQAAIALVKDFNDGKSLAMYVQKYNVIILREGEDLVSSLVHEIAHHAQHMERKLMSLGTLRTEFQAKHMEREILLMLPDDMLVSKEMKELRVASDQKLIDDILADRVYAELIADEKVARPNMASLDPVGDAKMIEDWFLAGSAAK